MHSCAKARCLLPLASSGNMLELTAALTPRPRPAVFRLLLQRALGGVFEDGCLWVSADGTGFFFVGPDQAQTPCSVAPSGYGWVKTCCARMAEVRQLHFVGDITVRPDPACGEH